MARKSRSLECPQCGGRIVVRGQYRCSACGHVLDMARISFEGALRHDRYESWRRKLEFMHAAIWALVSIAIIGVIALNPGVIMFTLGVLAGFAQVFWGKLILARLRRR